MENKFVYIVMVDDGGWNPPALSTFTTREKCEDYFRACVRNAWKSCGTQMPAEETDERNVDGCNRSFEECVDKLSFYNGGDLVIKAYTSDVDPVYEAE